MAGEIIRLDPLRNPEHMQKLITSGLIWRSAPREFQAALSAIQHGEAERMADREPPEVRAFLDKVMGVGENPLMRDTLDGTSRETVTDVGEPEEPSIELPE